MLYAASIAKYSTVTLGDGVLGIPANLADSYWTKAKDAASAIIESGEFALYGLGVAGAEGTADNFQNLFLDKTMHSEAIYTKAFSYANGKAHSFDFYNATQSFKVDYGCSTNPTVEMIEEFDYTDGSDGALKIFEADGQTPIQYSDPYTLFDGKDPRLHATVLLPGMPWQGGVEVEIRRGIVDAAGTVLGQNSESLYGEGANSIVISGKDGPLEIKDYTRTGFYIKKYMDPVNKVNSGRSDTYWMVFRYAEVLLNYAEAAMELGESGTGPALGYINDIRTRAGVATLESVDLAAVRKERKVELSFENHRWWDMIRWRIAEEEITNRVYYALHPFLVWEEGKNPAEMKYIFRIVPSPKPAQSFLPRHYYVNIAAGDLSSNPKLIQNPGY
jgi:hypothetical protein